MDYTGEVIKYIRRKDPVTKTFEPVTWLGAEQRFVGPLRNSNVNNLEEQYVFGTDTYTVTYKDVNNNDVIEKNFCAVAEDEDIEDKYNYYKTIFTSYNTEEVFNNDYKIEDGSLIFSNIFDDAHFGDSSSLYPDLQSLYLINRKQTFFFENSVLVIAPATYNKISEEKLYFVQPDKTNLLVLTKTIGERRTKDGKVIKNEHIVNELIS